MAIKKLFPAADIAQPVVNSRETCHVDLNFDLIRFAPLQVLFRVAVGACLIFSCGCPAIDDSAQLPDSSSSSLANSAVDDSAIVRDAEASSITDSGLENKTTHDSVAVADRSTNTLSDAELRLLNPDADRPQKPQVISTASSSGEAKKLNPNRVYELTFDDLKFEMEKTDDFERSLLTPEINQYDGAKIKLRGFIKPAFKQTGLTKFVFVRDNKECCFGPTAAIFDNVLVSLAKGQSTDYTTRPVQIEGEFFFREYSGYDGRVWSIYQMKNARVR